jgi:hypothetical protein
LAWTLVWPFDVIKSQVQGTTEKEPMWNRFKIHYQKYGLKGFFRGYGPGKKIEQGRSIGDYIAADIMATIL